MEADVKVNEISFNDAVEMLKKGGTKLVWLGREPSEHIAKLLELSESQVLGVGPAQIMEGDRGEASNFKGMIFACYHGNTSRVVSKSIKARFGIDSYSLKGGVTAVVGEIF